MKFLLASFFTILISTGIFAEESDIRGAVFCEGLPSSAISTDGSMKIIESGFNLKLAKLKGRVLSVSAPTISEYRNNPKVCVSVTYRGTTDTSTSNSK